MIWYLLYPLRGTTEPPQLSTSHPIRRAFQAHGTATARHWLLSILLTIAVAVPLCYPAIFQTDSPAATALRNLPKHVWTSTTEIDGEKPADVEVRQVWVHGDYMKAIDPRVLQDALYIQDALIGHGFADDSKDVYANHHMFARDDQGCIKAGPDEKWGFHSPLIYWNCSKRLLEEDQTPLTTINSRSSDQSVLNVTLRPSTVFAGKSFSNSKLVAADALVITLFDQTGSNLPDIWNARSRLLAEELSPGWSIFPPDGVVTQSRLYEFRFKPMTLNDDILLAASYMVTAAYVIWRMMQLRAVKSWFGLLITICVKLTVCVIASFTVCTFLGINLARIPRPWFPGVVFCFGLGNIFRLINVVLETPPEMPPQQRIGTALGQVGHLSLAVAVQNLALIYLCSHIVTPWVADFCVFAAVTLVFDFVFHLTFFVAVLSVDVQRMELSDSLDRADLNQTKKVRQERLSWFAALQKGVLPFSTRFAGTVAIFSIILAINWHFFDSNGQQLSFHAVRDRIIARKRKRRESALWSPPPINQARTPADWLRIQDHNTARELFGFIKPGGHSFVARIYDPLLVVLNGAKGRDRSETKVTLVDSLRRFAQQHAFPAALILVFLFAGVTLLMNYLLWTGLPEDEENEEDEEAIFSVRNLPTPQTLDVVRLVSCPKGHLVSISLDRTTSIWLYERRTYVQSSLHTAAMKPKLWPITASALDDSGSLLALCTDSGQIGLWSNAASRFSMFPKIELHGQVPILFTFATLSGVENDKVCIVIVTPDGSLIEIDARTGIHNTERISSNPIVCATLYTCVKGETCLVFVTKLGEVHIIPLKDDNNRASEVVAGLDPGPPPGSNPSKIKCIQGVPSLGLIFALRDEEAEIFDFSSRALVHAFQIGHVKSHSFRVMHSARRQCLCGAPAVHSMSVAYTEQDSDHMIMQTFTLDETPTSQICLGKSSETESHNCKGLDRAKESVHFVEPAGVWESTGTLSVVGIRRCVQSPTPSSSASGADNDYYIADASALSSALKQRATRQSNSNRPFASLDLSFGSRNPPASPGDTDNWEAWTMTTTGEFRSRPLVADFTDETEQLLAKDDLFVAAPGPITRLGKRSVAVGFGNTVKIITLGKESFDGLEDGLLDVSLGSHKWRSRRGPGRKLQ